MQVINYKNDEFDDDRWLSGTGSTSSSDDDDLTPKASTIKIKKEEKKQNKNIINNYK